MQRCFVRSLAAPVVANPNGWLDAPFSWNKVPAISSKIPINRKKKSATLLVATHAHAKDETHWRIAAIPIVPAWYT